MNNKGAPGLRKLCIFQSAMKIVNLGVYPESDPGNSLIQPIYFTCPFRTPGIRNLIKLI